MDLADARRAIRPLLRENVPRDAMAAYFAFHHPDSRTRITTYPPESPHPTGYVAVSGTGMDLFRPLVTWRLPPQDMDGSVALVYEALAPGTAVFVGAPEQDFPLAQALLDVQVEEHLQLYVLDPRRFHPIVNVLVTESRGPNGLARFVVRSKAAGNEVVATAHLNWRSPTFAEIGVNTSARFRRRGWGRSVVSAMVQHLLAAGQTPLYAVSALNTPSINLAQALGFVPTGDETFMLEGVLRPRP